MASPPLADFMAEGAVPPSIAGTKSGVSIILGTARCVWDDLTAAEDLLGRAGLTADLAVINHMGAFCPERFQDWYTLHGYLVDCWKAISWRLEERKTKIVGGKVHVHIERGRQAYTVHSNMVANAVDVIWKFRSHEGSSGLLAACGELCMGRDRIICCGMPYDNSGHFFNRPGHSSSRDFSKNEPYHLAWREAVNRSTAMRDRVRSMSGLTREWLGEPSVEWLKNQ